MANESFDGYITRLCVTSVANHGFIGSNCTILTASRPDLMQYQQHLSIPYLPRLYRKPLES